MRFRIALAGRALRVSMFEMTGSEMIGRVPSECIHICVHGPQEKLDELQVKVDAEKRVVAIVLATNGGTPGGSGLKDEEVAVEFSGAVPDALPARNRA